MSICLPKYKNNKHNTVCARKEILLRKNNQNIKHTEQRQNIKSYKGKDKVTYEDRPIKIIPDFPLDTLKGIKV